MSTALQLVNRVLRRLREEDVTALGDDLSNVILDHLNEGKRDLLESFTWSFDERTDGELLTMPMVVVTQAMVDAATPPGGSIAVDTTAFFIDGSDIDQVVGQRASAKLIITNDSTFGDTAFRVDSAVISGAFVLLGITSPWKGDSFAGPTARDAAYTLIFDEYVLPATVRAVTSMRHQEGDIQIVEVDRDIGLDAWSPRPHDDTSELPTIAFVGKTIHATYNTAVASTQVSGIGIKLDPTPGTTILAIHYSYIYRHPDLSATQDLEHVDGAVEDLIVRLAEARAMMSGIGADPETGAAMEQEVLNRAGALHGNQRRMPMRRYVISPTYGGSSGVGFGRLPRRGGYGSL